MGVQIIRNLTVLSLAQGVQAAVRNGALSPTHDISLFSQGKIMKGLDSMVRLLLRTQGTGLRWLREELDAANVRIRLTDGCLEELVRNADQSAKRSGTQPGSSYVERFRKELALRANFIQRWTGSDEKMTLQDAETLQELVRIARKYALPRRWKLSDPVVVEYRRKQPSYFQWTDDINSDAVTQG
jgi:hypothetical protein